MAINNKLLGTSANPVVSSNEPVLPKLIDHNTTEEHFQEGLDDVARQVDRTQSDIGYNGNLAVRVNREARSIDARLDTVEDALGVSTDNMGTITASSATAPIGGNFDTTMPDLSTNPQISGTAGAPRINDLAVLTRNIAEQAVTTTQIADGTITTTDIDANAGITRTQLETAIQNYNVRYGDETTDTSVNLGDRLTIRQFAQDMDGVVDGPASTEATDTNMNLYVLGSDNNWHRLNEFVRHGNSVPAAEVASTATGHVTTAAVPMGTSIATFLATGANRLEGTPPMQYGLEVGDYINFTNTTPTPDEQTALVYIGSPLAAGADGAAADFVVLGQAENFGFAANGALEFASGTRNLQLTSTIPGARTFSGAVDFDGNVELGDASTDTITVTGTVNSNIIPEGTSGGRALGSTTARWDVNADAISFNSITPTTALTTTATNALFAERSIDENRIDPTGSTDGQVLTSTGASTSPQWEDPPIGVEMVTTLPTTFTDYPLGVLVSLTVAGGGNIVGIYRSTGSAWERLGVIDTIYTQSQPLSSTSGTTAYTFNAVLPNAHFITVDGIVLRENGDYTVNTSNRAQITLTTAIADNGREIVAHSFSDVATIGSGQIPLTGLAAGTLPTGVNVPAAQVTTSATDRVGNCTNATTALNGTFDFGNGWTISTSANGITFSRSGTDLFSVDNDGDVVSARDITAFGTPVT